ncbi:ribbon-helix-helix domain-containing protein [Oceanicella actignis]|uniref:Predicted DNA-binding protein, contains Ribbon-helix-helix (RHH) domain n=1 Tax=Oceanicella actignis TaxID=1189325 RepID=A0A1M7S2K2_9RHOB|nr:ribbon-helix-helix domain-containing protein [Oceanicella actignis]TYO90185.1 putative DNA-binding ribbon-helix-helix protein [Oceanicella actignis]SES90082.1 Predicted DNA-binding protein, contains Ribbon-helix-helix (RHH) domain [Oceanicella actignis]SHN52743.1 Predicted DNA-binding protein, contains Ribbon-helix-helix (RHH) domain [Oceanicella actignis]
MSAPAPYAPARKRSVTLRGHRTSVSLEPVFWEALRRMARARALSVNALAARIDAERPPEVGLASALRQAVAAELLARAEAAAPAPED